jgi:hypothetical protein
MNTETLWEKRVNAASQLSKIKGSSKRREIGSPWVAVLWENRYLLISLDPECLISMEQKLGCPLIQRSVKGIWVTPSTARITACTQTEITVFIKPTRSLRKRLRATIWMTRIDLRNLQKSRDAVCRSTFNSETTGRGVFTMEPGMECLTFGLNTKPRLMLVATNRRLISLTVLVGKWKITWIIMAKQGTAPSTTMSSLKLKAEIWTRELINGDLLLEF